MKPRSSILPHFLYPKGWFQFVLKQRTRVHISAEVRIGEPSAWTLETHSLGNCCPSFLLEKNSDKMTHENDCIPSRHSM